MFLLRNKYSVIAVNPDKFLKIKYREAMDFISFVTAPEAQMLIAKYVKHGVNLFYPDAVPSVMGIIFRQPLRMLPRLLRQLKQMEPARFYHKFITRAKKRGLRIP